MKALLFITTLLIAARVSAQLAPPAPKKAPFSGVGNSALDRKPQAQTPTTLTPAPASTSGGLKLDDRWDTLTALSDRGPKTQRRELSALLEGFAEPGKDPSAHTGMEIYRQVTYLLPLEKGKSSLGLTGQMNSGGPPSVVGFPPGLKFAAFSAIPGRSFEVRLLFDRANQIVAAEFVAMNERLLPPPPEVLPPPDRTLSGKTYDFVPRGDSIDARPFQQAVWNRKDYVIIATRGGPKVADLYIPKAMVSIILYFLNLQGTN